MRKERMMSKIKCGNCGSESFVLKYKGEVEGTIEETEAMPINFEPDIGTGDYELEIVYCLECGEEFDTPLEGGWEVD